ncbi:hypothetical protein DE146DRAFT_623266 [Phaeosphaeria sp. MPI-PUGE-AT-0046c]|nr:hypothetical protein DE146DRAFT_623266 [Phaeosphaeria sp. MPI-PUGE-AT-0046c]
MSTTALTTEPLSSTPTLYFAFGSNLWLHQMSLRCPSSQYLGLARLSSYQWIINERGYANVVATSSNSTSTLGNTSPPDTTSSHDYSSEVWGMVYSLSAEDERALDKNEGVPHAYTKHLLECAFWPIAAPVAPPRTPEDVFPPRIDTSTTPPAGEREMLVYVDLKRVTPSTPREEYVYRMNRGVEDASKCGVPKGYVEGVVRGYIPVEEDEGEGKGGQTASGGVEEFAKGQARGFRDESGIF